MLAIPLAGVHQRVPVVLGSREAVNRVATC
jgi:fructose-1,6-bisphosphatase